MVENLKEKLIKNVGATLTLTLKDGSNKNGTILSVKEEDFIFVERGKQKGETISYEDVKDFKPFHVVVDKLSLVNNEVDLRKLNDGDKFQLLVRYFNDFATYLKNITIFTSDLMLMVKFICEKQGIDVEALKKQLADEALQSREKLEKQLKEKIENISKA